MILVYMMCWELAGSWNQELCPSYLNDSSMILAVLMFNVLFI